MTVVKLSGDDLDGDEEALFALRDSPGWVVPGEVMHGDQLGFDELGVVALELLSRFLEGFFDGATYAGRLGSDGHRVQVSTSAEIRPVDTETSVKFQLSRCD